MYLKSITLKGFKSFPDRTRLEFGPGVSVIVGPNGSGKSNITDAVLWALGEQSPMAVRGQSMQDVIFGGAPGRQAGRGAEVELVLDDSEGALGLGSPEVSVLRRLDRNGEGEYRLAGARCRLVDVIELLSDTGLGKEMHSVISQGRVEAIVTSKPRERRLLIEEAAGLGKHRKRRRRAQLKLARTQSNVDRALDVEREARLRLRPLKRQAEAAELHARLERQSLEARWELGRDQLRARQAELDAAQQEAAAARGSLEQTEGRLREVGERRERAEGALAQRSAQREELSRRCFAAASAADRIALRSESLRSAHASLHRRLARHEETIAQLEGEQQAGAEDPDTAPRLSSLDAEIERLESDRETELQRQLAELEAQLNQRAVEREELERGLQQATEARGEAEAAVEAGRQAVREAERAVEAARREAARVGGELAVVNQFLRSHAASAGGAATLADGLDVDSGYELAVAAALDGRLRATLVQNRLAGQQLLDRAGGEGGRALLVDAPRPRSPTGEAPGAAEPLAEHIRGVSASASVARALLADAWLVGSLDQVSEGFRGVAVTRSGRVLHGSTGELRQAPAVGEERVLAERNRRHELIRASEQAASEEERSRLELARTTGASAELEAERERVIAAHRDAVRRRDEVAEEERRLRSAIERRRSAPADGPAAARLAQLRAERGALRDALERRRREEAARRTHIARLRESVGRGAALLPSLERVITAVDGASEVISAQRARFQAALDADRQEGEHVASELRACAQEEAGLQSRLHHEHEALTSAEVGAQRLRDAAAEAGQELREVAARLELEDAPAPEALSAEERENLLGRIERLSRRREQLGPVNPLAQEEYAQALEHAEELETQRADLEAALRELEKLIADTDRQIRETFEQTFAAAAENFEGLAAQLFPGGRGRLRLVCEGERPARVLGGETATAGTPAADPPAGEEPEEGEGGLEEDLLGVEIEITPAGKAMKRLSLLSGGEKSMTALAFLFAVFLARPCPFYILDEVEAALDDLNIDRFLALLREYSKRAQFIVVTHQKRTMEAADSLYGVSMGGDGISKVISRRLPAAHEVAA